MLFCQEKNISPNKMMFGTNKLHLYLISIKKVFQLLRYFFC